MRQGYRRFTGCTFVKGRSGLTVEAATDVPAGACAGTHWTQGDKEH